MSRKLHAESANIARFRYDYGADTDGKVANSCTLTHCVNFDANSVGRLEGSAQMRKQKL
jgi:hypothetical protein